MEGITSTTTRFFSLQFIRHNKSPGKQEAKGKEPLQRRRPFLDQNSSCPNPLTECECAYGEEKIAWSARGSSPSPSRPSPRLGKLNNPTDTTADYGCTPPHPRAQFTSKELTTFYLLQTRSSAKLTSNESNSSNFGLNSSYLTPSLFPDLGPSHKEGDPRPPIPAEERNFHCISRNPAEFSYVFENDDNASSSSRGKKVPADVVGKGDELSEANMRKRWLGDYVKKTEEVHRWMWGAEFPSREDCGVETMMMMRRRTGSEGGGGGVMGKARERFLKLGKGVGKRLRGKLEGNALI